LEPAKECVTTHLPKCAAPKMDGAQVSEAEIVSQSAAAVAAKSRASSCREDVVDLPRQSELPLTGAPTSADLGCSSEYSIG